MQEYGVTVEIAVEADSEDEAQDELIELLAELNFNVERLVGIRVLEGQL